MALLFTGTFWIFSPIGQRGDATSLRRCDSAVGTMEGGSEAATKAAVFVPAGNGPAFCRGRVLLADASGIADVLPWLSLRCCSSAPG